MANQDSGHIIASGTLNALVTGSQVGSIFISMSGTGGMNIVPKLYKESGLIQMSGTLNSTEVTEVLVNAYVTMYGFLNANVGIYSSIRCSDLAIMFEEQIIESKGCSIGESMELKRYRGDTYPVSTTLSKNGSTDATGITFKMSTQIDNGTIYTVDGVIADVANGLVNFPLDILAVETSGEGVYDIQGNDGTYIYTYEKGVFTLLDDVTV